MLAMPTRIKRAVGNGAVMN